MVDRAPHPSIPARKRWGLVAGFVAFAIFPIVTGGTEVEPSAWAWTAFFSLNAIIAAFKPDTFL